MIANVRSSAGPEASIQHGWMGDATLLPFGWLVARHSEEISFLLANNRETPDNPRSTPARPLHESPILAGFFCTGATAHSKGGGS